MDGTKHSSLYQINGLKVLRLEKGTLVIHSLNWILNSRLTVYNFQKTSIQPYLYPSIHPTILRVHSFNFSQHFSISTPLNIPLKPSAYSYLKERKKRKERMKEEENEYPPKTHPPNNHPLQRPAQPTPPPLARTHTPRAGLLGSRCGGCVPRVVAVGLCG